MSGITDLANVPGSKEWKARWHPHATALWDWIEPKRYSIPEGYPSPVTCAGLGFASCLSPRKGDPEPQSRRFFWRYAVQHALSSCKVPTMLVSKQMAHALVRTTPPSGFDIERLRFPFPGMRFLFEQGSFEIDGGQLQMLEYGTVRKGDRLAIPEAALERASSLVCDLLRGPVTAPEDELILTATYRMDGSKHEWDGREYTSMMPLHLCKTIGDFLSHHGGTQEADPVATAAYLPPFSATKPAHANLFVNLLMLLTAKPEMVDGETLLDPGHVKRGRVVGALYSPRKVGFKFRIPTPAQEEAGGGTGRKLPYDWRCGHWKDQAHGPHHSLRKEIWIAPYPYGCDQKGQGCDA